MLDIVVGQLVELPYGGLKFVTFVYGIHMAGPYGSRISRKSESDFKKISDRPKVFRFFRFSTELESEISP